MSRPGSAAWLSASSRRSRSRAVRWRPATPELPPPPFDVAWTAAATSAVIGMLAARSRALPANRTRYTLWTLAAGSWLFGQAAWDVFGVIGFPASPNIADAGWWAFAVLVIASMLRTAPGPRSLKTVAALESAPLVVASVVLCLAELWSTAARSHLGLAPKLAALAYPSLYASATILMLHAMLGGRLRGLRSGALQLMLAGIAAQAIAFILWSGQLLRGPTWRDTRHWIQCGRSGSERSRWAACWRLAARSRPPMVTFRAAPGCCCPPECSSSWPERSSWAASPVCPRTRRPRCGSVCCAARSR